MKNNLTDNEELDQSVDKLNEPKSTDPNKSELKIQNNKLSIANRLSDRTKQILSRSGIKEIEKDEPNEDISRIESDKLEISADELDGAIESYDESISGLPNLIQNEFLHTIDNKNLVSNPEVIKEFGNRLIDHQVDTTNQLINANQELLSKFFEHNPESKLGEIISILESRNSLEDIDNEITKLNIDKEKAKVDNEIANGVAKAKFEVAELKDEKKYQKEVDNAVDATTNKLARDQKSNENKSLIKKAATVASTALLASAFTNSLKASAEFSDSFDITNNDPKKKEKKQQAKKERQEKKNKEKGKESKLDNAESEVASGLNSDQLDNIKYATDSDDLVLPNNSKFNPKSKEHSTHIVELRDKDSGNTSRLSKNHPESFKYLKSVCPSADWVTNAFGYRADSKRKVHYGVDLGGNTNGSDNVISPVNGVVTYIHNSNAYGGEKGTGNAIGITDFNGREHVLGHINLVGLKLGDKIRKGQLVGTIATKSIVTNQGTHLDYRIRHKTGSNNYELPITYLKYIDINSRSSSNVDPSSLNRSDVGVHYVREFNDKLFDKFVYKDEIKSLYDELSCNGKMTSSASSEAVITDPRYYLSSIPSGMIILVGRQKIVGTQKISGRPTESNFTGSDYSKWRPNDNNVNTGFVNNITNKKEWAKAYCTAWYNFLIGKGAPDSLAKNLSAFITTQDALESGYGTSNLAKNKSNFGGMMAGINYGNPDRFFEAKINTIVKNWPEALNAKNYNQYCYLIAPDMVGAHSNEDFLANHKRSGRVNYYVFTDGGEGGYIRKLKSMNIVHNGLSELGYNVSLLKDDSNTKDQPSDHQLEEVGALNSEIVSDDQSSEIYQPIYILGDDIIDPNDPRFNLTEGYDKSKLYRPIYSLIPVLLTGSEYTESVNPIQISNINLDKTDKMQITHARGRQHEGGSPDAGDQSGKEVVTANFYKPDKGWQGLWRPRDYSMAVAAASIARELADSNKVGYNQGTRNSLRKELYNAGWDVDKYLKDGKAADADCASFPLAVYSVLNEKLRHYGYSYSGKGTIHDSIEEALKGNGPVTWHQSLNKFFNSDTGFDYISDKSYISNQNNLRAGDILTSDPGNSGGHVVMVTTNGLDSDVPEELNQSKISDNLVKSMISIDLSMPGFNIESHDAPNDVFNHWIESIKYVKKQIYGLGLTYDQGSTVSIDLGYNPNYRMRKDCSGFVTACVDKFTNGALTKALGYPPSSYAFCKNDKIASAMESSGFIRLPYPGSFDLLQRGDIISHPPPKGKKSGHTEIFSRMNGKSPMSWGAGSTKALQAADDVNSVKHEYTTVWRLVRKGSNTRTNSELAQDYSDLNKSFFQVGGQIAYMPYIDYVEWDEKDLENNPNYKKPTKKPRIVSTFTIKGGDFEDQLLFGKYNDSDLNWTKDGDYYACYDSHKRVVKIPGTDTYLLSDFIHRFTTKDGKEWVKLKDGTMLSDDGWILFKNGVMIRLDDTSTPKLVNDLDSAVITDDYSIVKDGVVIDRYNKIVSSGNINSISGIYEVATDDGKVYINIPKDKVLDLINENEKRFEYSEIVSSITEVINNVTDGFESIDKELVKRSNTETINTTIEATMNGGTFTKVINNDIDIITI